MADANEDYAAMAAASRIAASAEVLENVRRKHLASAATWDGLAHMKSRIGALRSQQNGERSAGPLAKPST